MTKEIKGFCDVCGSHLKMPIGRIKKFKKRGRIVRCQECYDKINVKINVKIKKEKIKLKPKHL